MEAEGHMSAMSELESLLTSLGCERERALREERLRHLQTKLRMKLLEGVPQRDFSVLSGLVKATDAALLTLERYSKR
jgi:hypothetical protein